MVGKDWKLTAAESDVLATDKPFMDKVSEIVDLTDDEMALISGGGGRFGCGCGYGGGYGHRRFRHRRFHHFGYGFHRHRW
jgi:hypothetical protein